jgi:hypothetical protein
VRPANHRVAAAQAAAFARNRLRGIARKTKARRVRRAALMAAAIWSRWQVGIWQWQLKHVRWFFEHYLREAQDSVRYQYWLVLRELLRETNREHWIQMLMGSWTRP